MQVSAIQSYNKGFTANPRKRDNVDGVISISDDKLRTLAYLSTVKKDEQRRKKIGKLFMSVPLVAAASSALLTRGNAGMFGKGVSGLAAKTVNGIKAGGYWTMILGAASAIGAATSALSRRSESVDNFKKKHPFLTIAGQAAALFAVVNYLPKGASKLYNMIKPEYIAAAGRGVEQVAEHINKVKAPEFMKNWGKTISEHIPGVVKDMAATSVAWAPEITCVTAALASVGAYNRGVADYNRTYAHLKDKQLQIAQSRVNELKRNQEMYM